MRSLNEVVSAVNALTDAPGRGAMLEHCAQSIEYSIDGYPKPRSWVVRLLIGPRVLRRFLQRGFMKHDLNAPIPGAPAIDPNTPFEQGKARVLAAIARFQAHSGGLAPHFAYGAVTKDQYDAVHAMHVADHLSR